MTVVLVQQVGQREFSPRVRRCLLDGETAQRETVGKSAEILGEIWLVLACWCCCCCPPFAARLLLLVLIPPVPIHHYYSFLPPPHLFFHPSVSSHQSADETDDCHTRTITSPSCKHARNQSPSTRWASSQPQESLAAPPHPPPPTIPPQPILTQQSV